MSVRVEPNRDVGLQGHEAGIVTRLVAFLLDVIGVVVLYDLVIRFTEILVSSIAGRHFAIEGEPIAPWLLLVVIAAVYAIVPVAAGGRTLGMAIVGLRVVRPDRGAIGNREAVLRIVALPLSFATAGIGFLLILLRPDGRALHDLVSRTTVVYGWDARAARLRFLARKDGGQVIE